MIFTPSRARLGRVVVSSAAFALSVSAPSAAAQVSSTAANVDAAHARAMGFVEHVRGLAANPVAVLVRWRAGTPESERASLRALVGDGTHEAYTIVEDLELLYVRIRVRQAIERLAPFVDSVEPDWIVHADVRPQALQQGSPPHLLPASHPASHSFVPLPILPNDPSFTSLWGLNSTGQTINGTPSDPTADINAPEAWGVTTGDANFVVGVIDSGIQWNHPDLAANIWTNPGEIAGNHLDDDQNGKVDDVRGWDFYSRDDDPSDESGHGTHVAGTIGAVGNNGVGVVGVNWRCKLASLRFLSPDGNGTISDATFALQYAVQKGIRVTNNSWGGGNYSGSFLAALTAARTAGHLFVAAAGNDGVDTDAYPHYPGSYELDHVLTVGAITNTNARPSYSNYGRRNVDLSAPGSSVYSTYLGSAYTWLSGTSMACPHVTGAAALLWGLYPNWTYAQVRARLVATARPAASFSGRSVSGGVLDLAAAVASGPGANQEPSVLIQEPLPGTYSRVGSSLTLRAAAFDDADGDVTANVVWSSNLAGPLGTGGVVATSALGLGAHVITARSTDSNGRTRSVTTSVTIASSLSSPAVPSTINASAAGNGAAWITWPDVANNESSYEVRRQKLVSGTYTNTTTIVLPANSTSLLNSAGSGSFRYSVRAVNYAGASAWSIWRNVSVY